MAGWLALALAAAVAVLYATGAPTPAPRGSARASRCGWRSRSRPRSARSCWRRPRTAPRWADNPPARWLGKVSFGVFLFHFMVMLFCLNTLGFERGTNADFAALLAAGVAGSLVAGCASWRLIEQPARRVCVRRS